MTFGAIVATVLFGWLWFALEGPVIAGPITVYILAFIVGLSVATFYAIRSGDRRTIVAAGVLIANFAGSHFAWQTGTPILFAGILDLATASYFVLGGRTRWELAIGGLYLASILVGFLTAVGLVPSHLERSASYLAFSLPDLLALCGHFANATLGLASGDSGGGLREAVSRRLSFLPDQSLFVVLRQRITALRQ